MRLLLPFFWHVLSLLLALAMEGQVVNAFQVSVPGLILGRPQIRRHGQVYGIRRTPLPFKLPRSKPRFLSVQAVSVDPDDDRISKLAKALGSIGMNPEDSVAMFDYDSSEQAILLGYAVVNGDGQPIVQTPDVEHGELVKAYSDNRCVGVITPDEDSLKKLLDGEGELTLQSACGFDPSSPVGPRFCVVMSTDKSPEELQEEMGCMGRETDPETGLSFQVGLPVECHSFESLLALSN